MAGTLLAALGVAAGLHALPPAETGPMDEAGKLAEAIALTRICPVLMLDKATVANTLARAGVRLAPIMPEIQRQSEARALHYVHLDRRSVCRLARSLYGSKGTRAAGYLSNR